MTLARASAKTCPSKILERMVKTATLQLVLMLITKPGSLAFGHLRPMLRMGLSDAAQYSHSCTFLL